MAKSSTTPPHFVDNRAPGQDIVIGAGVRLRAIRDIHNHLEGSGISYRGLIAWIRSMNIPIVHIGKDLYINPFYFQMGVHAISRPGSPDFLVPGCSVVKKNRKPKFPTARQLSHSHLLKHVHTFVSEIVSARRYDFKKDHSVYAKEAKKIVERITQQYDVMKGPMSYYHNTLAANKIAGTHLNASDSPLLPRDERLSSEQRKSDVDPTLAPHNFPKD